MRKRLVIVPALNEEKNIGQVVDEILSAGLDLDVLVIDDGSVDRTGVIARSHGAKVITLPFNLGIGGAVQTGLKYAYRQGYDVAIQIDGDGQHIPAEIPRLLAPLERQEAEACIGSRYLGPRHYRTPFMRRLGMLIFSAVNSMLIGQRITDNTSGFRAFNRRAIAFLSAHYPTDYPEPETVVMLGRNGFRLQEVGVKMRQRRAGESSINSLRAIYYMIKVLLAILIDVFKIYPKISVTTK
ncbi:MAG: glycosyltransferase family 2 protein [candidate division KSB1 bacterium]|nr:glycosyltransferase family 2 protein [candidate division KSB1 bacterium]